MKRTGASIRTVATLGLAWSLLTLVGCAAQPTLVVVGTADNTLVTVAVPSLPAVSVNPDAGSAKATTTAANRTAGRPSAIASLTGLGSWVTVAQVMVTEGSVVRAGDVLATMDDAQLRAQVAVARADADVAASQPGVLQAKIDDTYDKADELADKRWDIHDGISTLKSTRKKLKQARATALDARPQLLAAREQLLAQRSLVLTQAGPVLQQRATLAAQRNSLLAQRRDLSRQLADLEHLLAHLPEPGTPTPSTSPKPDCHPTPTPTPPPSREQILASIAQLQAAIAQIDAGLVPLEAALAQIDTGLAPLNAALAQMATGLTTIKTGLAKIDTGLASIRTGLAKIETALGKARDGLTKLDEAEERLLDGRQKLQNLKRLARIVADNAQVSIKIARQQQSLAVVKAPVDGIVVSVAASGDVLAPGATLVTIREQAHAKVTAWLAPSELAQVCLNDRARIHGDWMAENTSLPAKINWIGERFDFPPSTQATDQVHLTRAMPVEFTSTTGELPAGVPVEITISGCRKAATSS